MNASEAIRSTKAAMEQYRFAFSVDCVIFGYGRDQLNILLVECNLPPYDGSWSLLGDFVRDDEDIDCAAKRVLNNYTGLEDIYLEQVATYGKSGRHPLGRVITTAYYSLMWVDSFCAPKIPSELKVKWFPIDRLPDLAFDHQQILESCHNRLQKQIRERPIGFELLPREFTLSQLRRLYEVALGIELDKRNFRRKLRSLNLIEPTEKVQEDVSHRPAQLFRFNHELYRQQTLMGLNFEL